MPWTRYLIYEHLFGIMVSMNGDAGRWQKMTSDRLETADGFLLSDLLRAELGSKLTPMMRKAAHAAVKKMEQRRLCRIELESFLDRRGRQQRQVVIYRPAFMDPALVVDGAPEKVSAPSAARKDHAPRIDNFTKLQSRSPLGSEEAADDRYVYTEWLANTWENDEVPGSPEYLRSHDLSAEQYEAIRGAEQAEYDAKMAADDGALCPHCDAWLLITEVASGEHERLCECCQINWADPAQVAAYEAAEDAAEADLDKRLLAIFSLTTKPSKETS
jgi:hypothetical protein